MENYKTYKAQNFAGRAMEKNQTLIIIFEFKFSFLIPLKIINKSFFFFIIFAFILFYRTVHRTIIIIPYLAPYINGKFYIE